MKFSAVPFVLAVLHKSGVDSASTSSKKKRRTSTTLRSGLLRLSPLAVEWRFEYGFGKLSPFGKSTWTHYEKKTDWNKSACFFPACPVLNFPPWLYTINCKLATKKTDYACFFIKKTNSARFFVFFSKANSSNVA